VEPIEINRRNTVLDVTWDIKPSTDMSGSFKLHLVFSQAEIWSKENLLSNITIIFTRR
jgi:hypothetical protein